MPVEMRGRHYAGAEASRVPPPPTLPTALRPNLGEALEPQAIAPQPTTDGPVERAFAAFIAPLKGRYPTEMEEVLFAAFAAGYSAAGQKPIEQLTGTKTSRTISAALRFFKEQVLLNRPEEITTGEWCSIQEVDALIAEWEGKDG